MLYDPHRKWAPRGICRWEDRHLFFAPGGQANRQPAPSTQRRWDQAKEICAMCPVKPECQRDTLGEEYGVFGGLDEHQRYQLRRRIPKAVDGWPEERRLAWAKEIYSLREIGFTWTQITVRTGLPAGVGERLLALWNERLEQKAKEIPGQIIDLELPEPEEAEDRLPAFPDRPGRKNCWVRHRGLVSDAWYRGETPDGAYIQATTSVGRGQANKWFAAVDVHLYRPVAAVILNYRARPDGEHGLTA
jgi:WhiB family redox-sensing transcriptional regulator